MNVVLATAGTEGDVRPMQAMAKAMQAAGHQPLLCTAPDFAESSHSLGIPFHPVGTPAREIMQRLRHVLTRPFRFLGALREEFERGARIHFDELMQASAGADLVVCSGLEAAGSSVAEVRGIRYKYVAYCAQVFHSRYHPPVIFPWHNLPCWINRFFWSINDRLANWLFLDGFNVQRQRVGLAPVDDAPSNLHGNAPLLAAEPALDWPPSDCRRDIIQTGAWQLPPVEGAALPREVEDFLAAGPPPVYIGFGSMGDRRPAQSFRTVTEAVRLLGCRAIVSQGWARLAVDSRSHPSMLQAPAGNCLVVGTMPHALLFPRVAAVIHHGGAGTTTVAARAGVPQVLVPHLLDQYYWAARIAKQGLGPRPIPRSWLTVRRLAKAIDQALEPALAVRAKQQAARLQDADGAAQAVGVLANNSP
ncbi:MAG: glycosyltransferase [Pseudomonadota bacterium]